MASENVELVEGIYASFARGESAEHAFDAGVVWHQREDLPDSNVHTGLDAIAAMIGDWQESFEGLTTEPDPPIDRGEHVVVPVTTRGRVRDTGLELELTETHVWTVRNGRVVEVHEFRTVEEGLASLPGDDG